MKTEISLAHNTSSRNFHDLTPSSQNLHQVSQTWARSRSIIPTDSYLISRGISRLIIDDPIFVDRVRIDERQNCIFPHWNKSGSLCGCEIKNKRFTGFSPGGEKGLWCSRPRSTDKIMVVCESAIDALSVATIFRTDNKRFFSTAGTCSPSQIASLVSAANRMPSGSSIWLAFDNDEGGRTMATELREELQGVKDDLNVFNKLPDRLGQDWNDALQENASNQNMAKRTPSVELNG